ncbi:MAG TPA: DUF87 domain-containing protein [Burkholderiales bacterium]|nr:DUF87 domain-containing protein [Burkholderiales bacterium]
MAPRHELRLDPSRFPSTRPAHAGNVRALQDVIAHYHLDEHDTFVRSKLAFLRDSVPSGMRAAAAAGIRERIARHLEFHTQYPFVVAPRGTLDAHPFPLHAHQCADNQRITIAPATLARHAMILGSSGAGKTTLAQQIAHEAYRRGLNVVTFDSKDDAPYFLTAHPETLLVAPDTPLPLLEPPPWMHREEYQRLVIRAIRSTWWGGQGTEQIGGESIDATYRAREHPSVADWLRALLDLRQKGDTYNRRDRIDATAAKLAQLIERYPGIATTSAGEGISPDLLCTRSIYFGFRLHTEVEDFLTTWLLELRFAYRRAHNIRHLDTLNVFDESVLLLHEHTITETASIAPTFPLLREFGTACLLTANNYDALPHAVKSNVSTHVVMAISDAREQRAISDTLGLDPRQRAYHATNLDTGQCIIKSDGTWKLPILAKFDNVQVTKSITADEWRSAQARTNQLARTRTPAAREGTKEPQPPTAQAPPASPPSRVAPVVEKTSPNELPLNERERAEGIYTAERGVAPIAEILRDLQLHPMMESRARKTLIALGLVEEHRVVVRSGRGGTAILLMATQKAYEELGIAKPHLGRGGASHRYYLRELRDHLGATLEVHDADAVLSYNDERHAALQRVLGIALNNGDTIAFEIELSNVRITAPRIAQRDEHFDHVIIATLPSKLDELQQCITRNERTILIDILRLLDALRTTESA